MKMSQDHVVPLSDPALAILDRMDRSNRHHELIFSSPDGTMFSENAMLAVLDRLGYGHVTVHGFRSTSASGTNYTVPNYMLSGPRRRDIRAGA